MNILTQTHLLSLSRSRWVDVLQRAAMAALAVMPLGMTVAHRSTPFFLGLSALFAMAAVILAGDGRALLVAAWRALRQPLGLAVLAFCAWSLVSLFWSEVREASLSGLSEFWLPIALAFVLGLALPRRMTEGAFWLLIVSVALSQLLMLMDLRSGLMLRKALGMRWDSYIFNRPSLTLLILLPAILAWLSGQGWGGRLLSACLVAVVAIAIASSDSGAAVLGLISGGAICLLALVLPRMMSWIMRAVFIGMLALGPVLGPLADHVLTQGIYNAFAKNHSRDRVDIWLAFDAVVSRHPLLGMGFGSSPAMNDTSVAQEIPPDQSILLEVGHPHNVPIQIWTELGAVGAMLAGLIGLLVLGAINRLPRSMRALSLGLAGAILAVGMVGHGAWQGWWAAAIGAAILWMRAAGPPQQEMSS